MLPDLHDMTQLTKSLHGSLEAEPPKPITQLRYREMDRWTWRGRKLRLLDLLYDRFVPAIEPDVPFSLPKFNAAVLSRVY